MRKSRLLIAVAGPYFQEGLGNDEITRWIPSLTAQEIEAARAFYAEHRDELDNQDRRIRERTAERIREHRERFPETSGTTGEHLARLRRLLQERRQECNGEGHPG